MDSFKGRKQSYLPYGTHKSARSIAVSTRFHAAVNQLYPAPTYSQKTNVTNNSYLFPKLQMYHPVQNNKGSYRGIWTYKHFNQNWPNQPSYTGLYPDFLFLSETLHKTVEMHCHQMFQGLILRVSPGMSQWSKRGGALIIMSNIALKIKSHVKSGNPLEFRKCQKIL